MSRVIARAESPSAHRPASSRALRVGIVIYIVYSVAVFVAIEAGRGGLALAVTLLALAATCLAIPHRRWMGYALLCVAPVPLLFDVSLAQPLAYLPPVMVNLGLAFVFGRTLSKDREPMISTFARLERGTLEPDLARYTRTLTRIWVAFFVTAAALAAGLAYASPVAWTWFVAVGNYVAVAALFAGEWLYRRWRFPQYAHASPLALARIVIAHWQRAATSQ